MKYDLHTHTKYSGHSKLDPKLLLKIARKRGWEGNNAYKASMIQRSNRDAPRGQKVNIWGGNLNHVYHPDKIVGYAVQARRIIAERKQFIVNHALKTAAVIEAYHFFKRKTICFAETKQVAKELQEAIGDSAVSYYSQMDSEYRMVPVKKEYKTDKGAAKFMDKHPDIKFDVKKKNGKFILSWKEERLLGEKKLKEDALRRLIDNRYSIDFISSVRSLNEGIDIPDLSLAIIHSRNSTERDMIQRIGRVARLFVYSDGTNKVPIILNIYLKNTKDEDWLTRAMKKIVGARFIDSLSEIFSSDNEFELVA